MKDINTNKEIIIKNNNIDIKIKIFNYFGSNNFDRIEDENKHMLLSQWYKDEELIGEIYCDFNIGEDVLHKVNTKSNLEIIENIIEKISYNNEYEDFENHLSFSRCDYEKLT